MLGMLINAKTLSVKAPPRKGERDTARRGGNVVQPRRSKAYHLAGCAARDRQIDEMMLAYGGVRVYTRDLYRVIARGSEINDRRRQAGLKQIYAVQLTKEAAEELTFWQSTTSCHTMVLRYRAGNCR